MKFIFLQLNKQAFTFIETLVAISILMISLVAPMSLAQDGVVAARLAQDQIIAFYAAQEGLEMVKNLRDQNRLANNDQLTGMGLCEVDPDNSSDLGCVMDAGDSGFGISDCLGETCDPLQFYPYEASGNTGVYGYGTGGYIDTKFTREIRVWYVSPPDRSEAIAEVKVNWQLGGNTQNYVIRNVMRDW